MAAKADYVELHIRPTKRQRARSAPVRRLLGVGRWRSEPPTSEMNKPSAIGLGGCPRMEGPRKLVRSATDAQRSQATWKFTLQR